MKAYGLTVKEYCNDSKKRGDLWNRKRAHNRLGQRTVLRVYKKVARRAGKAVIREGLED